MSPKLQSPHLGQDQGCSPAFGRREAVWDLCIFINVETETYVFYFMLYAGEAPTAEGLGADFTSMIQRDCF
jgi:hypothetical protein